MGLNFWDRLRFRMISERCSHVALPRVSNIKFFSLQVGPCMWGMACLIWLIGLIGLIMITVLLGSTRAASCKWRKHSTAHFLLILYDKGALFLLNLRKAAVYLWCQSCNGITMDFKHLVSVNTLIFYSTGLLNLPKGSREIGVNQSQSIARIL